MRYENPETGERLVLAGRNQLRRAKELEAAGWVRVGGTQPGELDEIKRREAAYREDAARLREENARLQREALRAQVVEAFAEVAGEGTDAELSGDGASEDAGDASVGDAGHLPDPGVQRRGRRVRKSDPDVDAG